MAPVNLLIAADDLRVVRQMTKRLEASAYNVCAVAHDGKSAILQSEKHQPDLVLVDIALNGEVNGLQTAERIRDRFNLPVIYLAAGSKTELPDQIKKEESLGLVINPFALQHLNHTIETALFRNNVETMDDYREKLRIVLENAGEICHELNQPMMAISGLSELLLFTMDQGDPAYEKIAKIQSQVQRMSALTQKLMGITRDERPVSC
jgi:DNA-binding response OmpR family regulator